MLKLSSSLATFLTAALILCLSAKNSPAAADAEFFEKKIRPVLATHCFECHSGETHESGLRVDSLSGILTGGERGPAIVPGKPDESLLISAIRHSDTLQMPATRKLPQPLIDDLAQWVREGAEWPDAEPVTVAPTNAAQERMPTEAEKQFWAFQTPQRSPIPQVHDVHGWARTPVDYFILAQLESRQLLPNHIADKRTLIRRATLALIGLPPTPEEVKTFLADESPTAFESVVERLLSSPRYGERWGRHWLDVVRYADSNGLDENLAFGNAWRYRDYVIEAFNADLPYDEFLREQLAGDLLPTADSADIQLRRIIATGFLSLGAKMLAEDDPVKMEMDIIDEQIDTLGKAVLGMTIGCARCHDHKFDPISAHDYYALAGIFKSTKTMDNFGVVARWQERPLALPDVVAERDRQQAAAEAVQADIVQRMQQETDRITREARAQMAAYMLAADRQLRAEESLMGATPVADNEARRSAPECLLLEAEDYARGNVMKDTTNYGAGIGVLVNQGELPNFTEYDIELPQAGLYQFDLRYAAAAARPTVVTIDGKPIKTDAAGQVTGSWTAESQRWFVEAIVEVPVGKHIVRLENAGPFPHIDKLCIAPVGGSPTSPSAAKETLDTPMIQLHPQLVANLVRLLTAQRDVADGPFSLWWKLRTTGSLEASLDSSPLCAMLLADPMPTTLAALALRYQELANGEDSPHLAPLKVLLSGSDSPFSLGDKAESLYSETVVTELRMLREKKAAIEAAIPAIPEAMSVSEGSPQNLRIHLRGSHTTLGVEVPRRIPRVFATAAESPISDQTSGRLRLAEWLTQPSHPLTARVLVNRVWQAHFGEGLVRSPDNFGRLGEKPTHPELLDWLAIRFIDDGWSIKSLHRLILNSAVWQQSTDFNQAAAAIDPENRLLWRINRRRLEAEAIRDSLLAIGGGLDTTMGGTLLPTANRNYVTSTANINVDIYEAPRRTIYLPVVRSALNDYLTAFDFGDPSAMSGQRDRTTVAPQSLFLMNSKLVASQSKNLATSLLDSIATDAGRITEAFERFYSRPPTQSEIESSLNFIALYEDTLRSRGVMAEQLRPQAWQAFCRALMATNEFLYVN
ncbi:MAG: DUF1553 domain-containing protein [Fuerstia sp.]|nr:DUF1553 domain-containing protein [Fuerstiella sp.]